MNHTRSIGGYLRTQGRFLTGRPFVLLTVWAFLWFFPAYLAAQHSLTDWYYLSFGGRALVGSTPGYHGSAIHLYAQNPWLQVGPPALVLAGPIALVFGANSHLVAGLAMLALGLLVVHLCRQLRHQSEPSEWWLDPIALVGGAALLPVWAVCSATSTHLDDALALTGLVLTGVFVAKGWSWPIASVVLGTAIASKPWVLGGVVLLLALPGHAKRLGASSIALVTAPLWWAPFVLGDHATLAAVGKYAVPVAPGSVLHLLGVHTGIASPPWVRPAQLYLGLAAALIVGKRRGWFAAPLAVVLTRILLDPQVQYYYALGPIAFALLLEVSETRHRFPIYTAATALVEGVLVPFLPAAAWLQLSWIVITLTALMWRDGDSSMRVSDARRPLWTGF